jgi:guanylate kinase
MKGKLIIFSAPSGSGKTTIVKEILKTDIPFGFSVSATSRPARKGETHAKDYYFFSVDEFKEKAENGEFIEWEEVYHNQFYGTLKSEIERLRNMGKHVLFDIDVVGGLNLKNQFKEEALAIFILPPSLDELEKRLKGRGTEDDVSLKKRLDKSEHEMSFAHKFDVQIVNDKLSEAVDRCINKIESFIAN